MLSYAGKMNSMFVVVSKDILWSGRFCDDLVLRVTDRFLETLREDESISAGSPKSKPSYLSLRMIEWQKKARDFSEEWWVSRDPGKSLTRRAIWYKKWSTARESLGPTRPPRLLSALLATHFSTDPGCSSKKTDKHGIRFRNWSLSGYVVVRKEVNFFRPWWHSIKNHAAVIKSMY